jgi:hypothetical protein
MFIKISKGRDSSLAMMKKNLVFERGIGKGRVSVPEGPDSRMDKGRWWGWVVLQGTGRSDARARPSTVRFTVSG